MTKIDLKIIAKKLHKFNFDENNGIIKIKNANFSDNNFDYTYNDYYKNKHLHNACDTCSKCNHFNNSTNSQDFYLTKDKNNKIKWTNVSHGSHSIDFFDAILCSTNEKIDYTNWSTKPVLFLMENPSTQKQSILYNQNFINSTNNSNNKFPTQKWYWIWDECKISKYPENFSQGSYGSLINSIINTFQIANGYVTNLVKCGMGEFSANKETYTSTEYYNPEILKICNNEKLLNEINILRNNDNNMPVIIFAFGKNSYYPAKELLLKENCKIYLLPHPANRLANDYRKFVLFTKILKALKQNNFYDNENKYVELLNILIRDSDYNSKYVNINDFNDKLGKIKTQLKINEAKNKWTKNTFKVKMIDSIIEKDTKYINEILVKYRPSNQTIEFGYNFLEKVFWIWSDSDYLTEEQLKSLDYSTYSNYKKFKEIIETD